jgi:hypothetical protein
MLFGSSKRDVALAQLFLQTEAIGSTYNAPFETCCRYCEPKIPVS